MSVKSIITAFAALLAFAVLVLPDGAFAGRGGFASRGISIHGSFRTASPRLHHAFVRPRVNPALFAHRLHHRFLMRTARGNEHFRFQRFAFRHHRDRFDLGLGAIGVENPYYGSPYDPADYADNGADPEVTGGPKVLSYDDIEAGREPQHRSCRAQDYVVPNLEGEDHRVTVVRCY